MNKEAELKKAQRTASILLVGATTLFFISIFIPKGFWVNGLKAITEAAMVGALADLFAVTALFRRVPIPFISRHTAIIPRNKDKIADNLAAFVKEKFLDASSIVDLIRKHNPAQSLARWLSQPTNADRLGGHLVTVVRGALDFTDDARIQQFLKEAINVIIDKVDLSKSLGAVLDNLTKDGRHQELLDDGAGLIMAQLNDPATRKVISDLITQWLKREHHIKEKILPTEWLSKNLADQIATIVNTILDEVVKDQGHKLREDFDGVVQRLIQRLKDDPAMSQRAEEIKQYLKNDETLNLYVKELWGAMRSWLKHDLNDKQSVFHEKLTAAGHWVGSTLAHDTTLQASLNEHMEKTAYAMAPDFSDFLTQHISDTVKRWDAQDMSRQIELNIGKDLQFIRINGTIVGGLIGLVLYLLSQLPDVLQTAFK